MKIVFRADTNQAIGLGHVSRCIALAEMLIGDFLCEFFIKDSLKLVKDEIIKIGATAVEIPNSLNQAKELEFIASRLSKDDIVVLDGYFFNVEYQETIKQQVGSLVQVDDIADKPLLADIIINHTGGIQKSLYSKGAKEIYIGPEYALIRRDYIHQANKERKIKEIKSVFICLGGSDNHNITEKVIGDLYHLKHIDELHIVCGPHNKWFDQLRFEFAGDKCKFYQSITHEEMIKVMHQCQVGVCSSSTLAYECCCVGMGIITGFYVDNQELLNEFLSKNEFAISVGDFKKLEKSIIRSKLEEFSVSQINELILKQKEMFKNVQNNVISIFQKLQWV